MKILERFVWFLVIGAISFCIYEANQKPEMYYNIDLKIESINGQTAVTQDKFKNIVYCNTIVFSYKKLNYIYNTCADGEYEYKPNIDKYWILKHKVGDVIRIKEIPKSYFK